MIHRIEASAVFYVELTDDELEGDRRADAILDLLCESLENDAAWRLGVQGGSVQTGRWDGVTTDELV